MTLGKDSPDTGETIEVDHLHVFNKKGEEKILRKEDGSPIILKTISSSINDAISSVGSSSSYRKGFDSIDWSKNTQN